MRTSSNLLIKRCIQQKYLLMMVLIPVSMIIIFSYLPMYGLILAFKDYRIGNTILGSKFVGFHWFELFFQNPMSLRLFTNTLKLGVYWTFIGWPAPIILALLFNEISSKKFRKIIQTTTYLPYFISTVIIVGIMMEFTSLDGNVNQLLGLFGIEPIAFIQESKWFRTLYFGSGLWQIIGWNSIIYLAAIAGVDQELFESATIDGANRWHRLWYITLPSILPTVTIMFIFNIGSLFSNDFQKILLMYNPVTYDVADVIGTYVFREGITNARYSYGVAVGLILSVISGTLVFISNFIIRKVNPDSSLF